jgi:peptidoglycan/xylan/chitin deacetylase (PgdA/CDA1 family)
VTAPGERSPAVDRHARRAATLRRRARRRKLAALLGGLLLAVTLDSQLGGASTAGRHAAITTASAAPARTTRSAHTPPGATAEPPTNRTPERAVPGVLAYTPLITRGGGRRREIALTFDDGPGPYTKQILRVLARHNAKATFFIIGRQERAFHAATTAAIKAGHAVGDHTESHAYLAGLVAAAQREQLQAPLQWLGRYGLPRPELFRPPYGSYDDTTLAELKTLGLLMVLWTVDTEDYRRPGVQNIITAAVAGAEPGAIILLHDGGGDRSETLAALPHIIGRLRDHHYHLVTIPQLLADDPPPDNPHQPHPSTER